jgi:hypothetical protein
MPDTAEAEMAASIARISAVRPINGHDNRMSRRLGGPVSPRGHY